MNIIIHSKRLRRSGHISFNQSKALIVMAFLLFLLPVGMLYTGYTLGQNAHGPTASAMLTSLYDDLNRQRREIGEAKRVADDNVNALSIRLAQMQAQMWRLNALGERLTKMAKLDRGEFDFDAVPAQGGPAEIGEQQSVEIPDFLKRMDELTHQVDDRSKQLAVLESMLMNRNLQAEVLPAGRPIKRGWTSSFFGMRTDPFTGKLEHHKGVDFAGKDGSDIISVASGVVTYAGPRYGYGNLVEVNHGNGYVTRYGHCKEIMVKVGDTVKKGQLIALMGSTGRSTGPHVHFEVRLNGKNVNPEKYVQMAYR